VEARNPIIAGTHLTMRSCVAGSRSVNEASS
jgi:hypothetical protein